MIVNKSICASVSPSFIKGEESALRSSSERHCLPVQRIVDIQSRDRANPKASSKDIKLEEQGVSD